MRAFLLLTLLIPSMSLADITQIVKMSHKTVVAVIDTGVSQICVSNCANFGARIDVDIGVGTEDTNGHGTHVYGIIRRINVNTSLLSFKYYEESSKGTDNMNLVVKAFRYAIDYGAQVINFSGGGDNFNEEEYLEIKRAQERGIIVVAAAGNEGRDIDKIENHFFPASYNLPNIIVVGSYGRTKRLSVTSNWGEKVICAPGENILSDLPKGKKGYMSGTSMATAYVTGVVSRLLGVNPRLSVKEIRKMLEDFGIIACIK